MDGWSCAKAAVPGRPSHHIDREDTVTVASGIRAAINGDGAVLLDIERGTLFSLNGVGATIWAALEGGGSREEILAVLARTFPDVSQAALAQDLEDFMSELARRELVRT